MLLVMDDRASMYVCERIIAGTTETVVHYYYYYYLIYYITYTYRVS